MHTDRQTDQSTLEDSKGGGGEVTSVQTFYQSHSTDVVSVYPAQSLNRPGLFHQTKTPSL